MTAFELVDSARTAGVVLTLADTNRVTAKADHGVLVQWVDRLRQHKPDVLRVLQLERAERTLQAFADRHGIPLPAARSQMTEADLIGGLEPLDLYAKDGDQRNLNLLVWWLELLVQRARGTA